MTQLTQQDEMARRLDAFAEVTLRPDPAAIARIRMALLAAASAQSTMPVAADSVRTSRQAGLAGLGSLRRLLRRKTAAEPAVVALRPARPVRRVAFAMAACALVLAVSGGAVAASGAGGPLYGARLWLERATVPAGGPQRTDREIALLDERLAEIRSAASRGDRGALVAAGRAYDQTADDAAADAGTDRSRLDAALTRHVAVLEGLLGSTGGNSQQALTDVIARANETIQRIESGAPGGPPVEPPGNGAGTGPAGDPKPTPTDRAHETRPAGTEPTPAAATDGHGGPGPNATPDHPSPPPHPSAKPKPTPPDHPDKSPKPGRTPTGNQHDPGGHPTPRN